MKRLWFLILLLLSQYKIGAQNYVDYQKILLPDSITAATGEWMDVDNSGLLDIVLFATVSSGNQYLMFIPGDTVDTPALSQQYIDLPHYDTFVMHDYDNDNQLDFVLAVNENGNRKTVLVKNLGDFNFSITDLPLPYFTFARFTDLDQDARPECVLSGEDSGNYFTKTFKSTGSDWLLSADTLKVKLTAFESVDFNKDGFEDIFMSGMVNPDSTFSAILERDKKHFSLKIKNTTLSTAVVCDLDTDGILDVYALGSDKGLKLSHNFGRKTNYEITSKTALNLKNAFFADLDADGLVDENYINIFDSDTTNILHYSNGTIEAINHKELSSQYFGDLDHDGDLDLFQVIKDVKISISILKNKLHNGAPGKPFALAIPLYDYVFLFWNVVGDDHTPENSITYDVFLEGGSAQQDVTFDLISSKRLAVKHGNNGTNNFRILKNIDSDNFNYAIQSVDNSYHAGGICTGSGTVCVTSVKEIVEACTNEEFTFSAPEAALWFSLTEGFLGKSNSVDYKLGVRADTLFYFIPVEDGCARIGLFEVNVNNAPKPAPDELKHICADVTTILSVNSDWENIAWKSDKQGNLGSNPVLNYKSSSDDVVMVEYSNDEGCTITKEITIKISRPDVAVMPENSKIMKGQSINLVATGAATYVWTPSVGLSAADIPDPIASPIQDMLYTVTGYDSVGCSDSASATVNVDVSGFITTLFSPNGDGKNDILKIYGLTAAEGFSLKIFNREGKLVYGTENLNEALSSGWDGTANGVNQPNGVYFWKVSGSSPHGRQLTLNGQKEGSLVLLR